MLLWGVVFMMVIKTGIDITKDFAITITSNDDSSEIKRKTDKGLYNTTKLSIRFFVAMALILSMAKMSLLI